MVKRLGYFRKKKSSNKRLIELFEENQKLRFSSTEKDWQNKKFTQKLEFQEKKARQEITRMLKDGKIRTADDFYRAAFMFQHGDNYKSYSLAVTLAAVSMLLGESWAKNFYTKTIDRFLLSLNQPQIFFTQYVMHKGRWSLSPYNKNISSKVRKLFGAETLKKALEGEKKLNEEN